MGQRKRSRRDQDGNKKGQRPRGRNLAFEACAPKNDSRARPGTRTCGQRVRSLGTQSRRVLFPAMEAGKRRGGGRGVQGKIDSRRERQGKANSKLEIRNKSKCL